jgi:hypothetical protein
MLLISSHGAATTFCSRYPECVGAWQFEEQIPAGDMDKGGSR